MIAKTFVAVLSLAALAAPALADQATSASNDAEAHAFVAGLANASAEKQARLQLAHQGYVGISTLERDDDGRWVGTATKDGKTVFVAVELPRAELRHTN